MPRRRIRNPRIRAASRQLIESLSIIDPDTGLYKKAYFRLRLREERRRSERSDSPFSLIVIDTNSFSLGSRLSDILVETVLTLTRETDIKAWYDDGKIAVLMPNTSDSGARILAKKLVSKVHQRLREVFGTQQDWHADRCMTIATYPDEVKEESVELGLTTSTFEGRKGTGAICRDEIGEIARTGSSTKKRSTSKIRGTSFACSPLEGSRREDSCREARGAIGTSVGLIYADLLDESVRQQWRRAMKRTVDIIGSTLGLIISLPLLFGVALLVKFCSSGPILFRQTRVGMYGNRFTLLKFRSMYHRSDGGVHRRYVEGLIDGCIRPGEGKGNGRIPYKKQIETRITSVGKILRRTAMDELPQLLNVLRGDMSLVGPRPHPVYEVSHYRLWYRHRQEMKPGLTGLSKIHVGDSSRDYEQAARLDLRYVENWSIPLDLKIIFGTIAHVVLARGG